MRPEFYKIKRWVSRPDLTTLRQIRHHLSDHHSAAKNKELQIDKLVLPTGFSDALSRGVGESGIPLVETTALSYHRPVRIDGHTSKSNHSEQHTAALLT
jgi:hypothetical protein